MAANQEDFLRTGLRATTSSDDMQTQCTICLQELQSGQDVDQIRRCGHAFHKHCLLSWINSENTQHSSCPNCRQELFPTRHPPPPRPEAVYGEGELASQLSIQTDMLAAFRNYSDLLMSELRRHNLGIPGTSPGNPQYPRALRAVHGVDPLPAYVIPHPATGEYTTVKARWRMHFQTVLSAANPPSRATIDDLWRDRSAFVRDLERLEQLRLEFGPQAVPNIHPQTIEDQTRLLTEYGTLLDKLMPQDGDAESMARGVMRSYEPTRAVLRGIDPRVQQEARLFSLLPIAAEDIITQSLEETLSNIRDEYGIRDPEEAVRALLQGYRLTRFINSGVDRHYMASEGRADRSSIIVPPAREPAVNSMVRTPTRPARQREVSSVRPNDGGSWQPGMSPFRSRTAELESMRVSWLNGSPRGTNAEALLDPRYLRWRQEQGEATILNSPRTMAAERTNREVRNSGLSPSQHRHSFVNGNRLESTQLPSRPDMDEPMHPPQIRKPYLNPVEMGERRETHGAFFGELERLNVGAAARAEASRLFPRRSVYDRSVQSDPIAVSAWVTRILRQHWRVEGIMARGEDGGDGVKTEGI